ncbi:hypothetical protein [Ktedonospora formicarum]|uniref:Uncharacterized protein n=1 Tax=Ktedonospora formicarum TaxID=2778364 RepID=A0A8J3I1L1_9CHLR|nr:hypothetical protein [Ktedonospora formicarum]GHO47654.1 hypothetical protein KSX_58170 [Ktedonospora formicarum]
MNKYMQMFLQALGFVVRRGHKQFLRYMLIAVPVMEVGWIVPDRIAVPVMTPLLIIVLVATWRQRVKFADNQHVEAAKAVSGQVLQRQRTNTSQYLWGWLGWAAAGLTAYLVVSYEVMDSFPWILRGIVLSVIALPCAQLGQWLVQAHLLTRDMRKTLASGVNAS